MDAMLKQIELRACVVVQEVTLLKVGCTGGEMGILNLLAGEVSSISASKPRSDGKM